MKEKKKFNKDRCASFIKELPSKLFCAYKRWLYGEKKTKASYLVKEGTGRIKAGIIALALFLVFGLYYLGLYDISFIERPVEWENNRENFLSIFREPEPETNQTGETAPVIPDKEYVAPDPTVPSVDFKDTLKRPDKNSKINYSTVFKTSTQLEAEGYWLTDGVYDENTCEVALMDYAFELPEYFSAGKMTVRDWVLTEYDDGRETTVEEVESVVERPAIYLYMGYIIYDDGRGGTYLADSKGNILMEYDESYIPAMARTKDGKPLFYKPYTYWAEAPTTWEANEAGEQVITGKKSVSLKGKTYYSLSGYGSYFVKEDYVEERDGRGLNFDFTDDYGLSDRQIVRVGIMSPKITTFLNGKSELVNNMRWGFYLKGAAEIPKLDEIIAERSAYAKLPVEQKLELQEAGATPDDKYDLDTALPYSHAYNYSESYATVVTSDTGDDPMYEMEELRVLNTYGEPMFASKKLYYNNSIKDWTSDRYLLPLSKGEDSVGHLYFDHGLLRVRKVSYDNYQLEEFGDYRVNIDEDVLVYPNGKEFPIPEGYKLCGYSDGILVLERGGLYGYMDHTGRWIADPEYVNAEAFHGGVGVLTHKSGSVCAVNTNGDFVLPNKFTYIQNRSDGLIAAYSETDGWQVYGIYTK